MLNLPATAGSGLVEKEYMGLFLKQIMTTLIGNSYNKYQQSKDSPEKGYLVALDTESHDYVKFFIRAAAIGVLVMCYNARKHAFSAEEQKNDGIFLSQEQEIAHKFHSL